MVANHFSSKGGDDPLFGPVPAAGAVSAAQRHQQAQAVRGFVDQILAADPGARVVVLGDLNDFEFSPDRGHPGRLGRRRWSTCRARCPLAERYSYVFEGNSQVLDHILIVAARWRGPATRTTWCT